MEESKTKEPFDEDTYKTPKQATRVTRSESTLNVGKGVIESRSSMLSKIAEWFSQGPKSGTKNIVELKKDDETEKLDEEEPSQTTVSPLNESLSSDKELYKNQRYGKAINNLSDDSPVPKYEESDTKRFASAKDSVKRGPKKHLLQKYQSDIKRESSDAAEINKEKSMDSFSSDSYLDRKSEEHRSSSSDTTNLKPLLKNPENPLRNHELVKHMFHIPVFKPIPKDSLELISKKISSKKRNPTNQSNFKLSGGNIVQSKEGIPEQIESADAVLSKKVEDNAFEVLKSKNVGGSSGMKDKPMMGQDVKSKKLKSASDDENIEEKPAHIQLPDPKANFPEESRRNYPRDKEISREHRKLKVPHAEAHPVSESHNPANCSACKESHRKGSIDPLSKNILESASSSTELPESQKNASPNDKVNIKPRQLKRQGKANLPKKLGNIAQKASHSKEIKFQDFPNAVIFGRSEEKNNGEYSSSEDETFDEPESRLSLSSNNVTKKWCGNEGQKTVSDNTIETSRQHKKPHNKDFNRKDLDSSETGAVKKVEIDPTLEEIQIDSNSLETKKSSETIEYPRSFMSVYEKTPIADKPRPKPHFLKKIHTDSLEVLKARKDIKRKVGTSDEDATDIPNSTPTSTVRFTPETKAAAMLGEIKSMMEDLSQKLPNLRHDCRCGSGQKLDSGLQNVLSEADSVDKRIKRPEENEPEGSRRQHIRSTSPNIESITIDTKKFKDGSKSQPPIKNTQIYPIATRPPRPKSIPMISETLQDALAIPGVQSVSATTLLGSSRVQTVYHFGDSDTEQIEVFVDAELRAKIVKDPTHDTYCNTMQHNDFAPGSNVNASTVIVANGCQMRTSVSRKGCKETIAVYKNGDLLCKTGNSVFEEI